MVNLQPQLHTSDDIYIIDASKDRSGLKIATLYGTTRCYIFVELRKTIDKAEKAGFESVLQNKQEGGLVLSENTLLSQTFISNLKKAIKLNRNSKYDALMPEIVKMPYPRMDQNFRWFNPPTKRLEPMSFKVSLEGAWYLKSESIKKDVWRVGVFENEKIVVLSDNPSNPDLQ